MKFKINEYTKILKFIKSRKYTFINSIYWKKYNNSKKK